MLKVIRVGGIITASVHMGVWEKEGGAFEKHVMKLVESGACTFEIERVAYLGGDHASDAAAITLQRLK